MSGLLAVHAHPDDETITQGGTLARYAAEGRGVVLVTCTRGEQGEVIPEDLARLAGSADLGPWRAGELAAAMAALGVTDHRFLDGADPPYVDSGMAWGPDGLAVPAASSPPGAFALADLEEAASRLAAVIREVRPDAVTTYGPDGGYGHPDHVRVHQVTMRAVELEPVPRVYWISPAEEATVSVDVAAYLAAKVAALREHGTQVRVSADGTEFALSSGPPRPVPPIEHYRQVTGPPPEGDLL